MERKILVIDDEEIVLESCRQILSSSGFSVECAKSLDEARSWMGRESFDLIITDLMMPGGSGLELLEGIAKGGSSASLIMITGYGTVDSAVEAMKLGAEEYLTKPFTPEQLLSAVRTALQRRKERMDRERSEAILAAALEEMDKMKGLEDVMDLIVRSVGQLPDVEGCLLRLNHPYRKEVKKTASYGMAEGLSVQKVEDEARVQWKTHPYIFHIPLKISMEATGALIVRFLPDHKATEHDRESLLKFSDMASAVLARTLALMEMEEEIEALKGGLGPSSKTNPQQ
jgi:FixJ family two-component response regulator